MTDSLHAIKVHVTAARQYFDNHNLLAAEVSDRMHLKKLELLLTEIERLQAENERLRAIIAKMEGK